MIVSYYWDVCVCETSQLEPSWGMGGGQYSSEALESFLNRGLLANVMWAPGLLVNPSECSQRAGACRLSLFIRVKYQGLAALQQGPYQKRL